MKFAALVTFSSCLIGFAGAADVSAPITPERHANLHPETQTSLKYVSDLLGGSASHPLFQDSAAATCPTGDVPCQNNASLCVQSGYFCCNDQKTACQNGGLCCYNGSTHCTNPGGSCCGTFSCNSGTTCCGTSGCAPSGSFCCGTGSCPNGDQCCPNSGCAPKNASCCSNGSYCPAGTKCVTQNGKLVCVSS